MPDEGLKGPIGHDCGLSGPGISPTNTYRTSEASISLILKPDKDPLNCNSYCPISLLNTDYKILANTLTSRITVGKSSAIIRLINQANFIKDTWSIVTSKNKLITEADNVFIN